MQRAVAVVVSLAAVAAFALAGMLIVNYAEVGADRTCVDVYIRQVMPICVAPTAAPWALALGAAAGAGAGVGAALLLRAVTHRHRTFRRRFSGESHPRSSGHDASPR